MSVQQPFHLEAKHGVGAAGCVEVIRPLCRRFLFERGEEYRFDKRRSTHGNAQIPKGPDHHLTKPFGTPQTRNESYRAVECRDETAGWWTGFRGQGSGAPPIEMRIYPICLVLS